MLPSCSWLSWCIDSLSAVQCIAQVLLLICTVSPEPKSDLARNPTFQEHEAAGWVGYWLRMNSPMQYLPGGTSVWCAGHLLQFLLATPDLFDFWSHTVKAELLVGAGFAKEEFTKGQKAG